MRDDDLFERAYSPAEGIFKLVPHHWLELQRDVMNDVARYAKLAENDGLHWPRRDGLKWPHFASVVVLG